MKRAQLVRTVGIGLLVAVSVTIPVTAAGPAAAGATVAVRPGQSIQAAIDAAAPGATIVVRAGTYAENLEITKDDLTIKGAGPGRTVLVQPPHPVQRFCTPDPNDPYVAGICATGEVDFNTAQIKQFLHRTRISGFSVRDFTGVGILLVGVEDGVVEHNETTRNDARGILALNSTRSVITGNVVRDNDGAGIQIDRFEFVNPGSLPPADATVIGNTIGGTTAPGIFVFDADQGRIVGNITTGNCGGILFVNLAGTGRGWTASFNVVKHNNLACPPEGGPPLSGLGIGVVGAVDIRISHNLVTDNQPTGPSQPSGGIAVANDANDVQVTGNVVRGNQPTDLAWDGSGTDVTFTHNVCATSTPARLCP